MECIEAALTLLNDRLQQAHDTHVRFLASYYAMKTQRSDDPVHKRCAGVDLAAQRYVVAPASVDANHWAVIVWDHEERRILLLDSYGDLVNSTQAARLRRIMLRGDGRAQAQCRLPVVRQQDRVSCGLFVLFYCCFIVGDVPPRGHASVAGVAEGGWSARCLHPGAAARVHSGRGEPGQLDGARSWPRRHHMSDGGVSFIRVTTTLLH